MPRYKVAFFDIDGTLRSFKTGHVPASTKRALAAMRERGVETVICTGRPPYLVEPEVAEGFDSFVGVNGQLCQVRGQVVRSVEIAREDVRTVVDLVDAGLYNVVVMLGDRLFVSGLTPREASVAGRLGMHFPLGDIHDALSEPVYQFCAFLRPEEEAAFLQHTTGLAATRWHESYCDLVPAGGSKAEGVRAVLAALGASPDEAIGFGDGENDIAMFEACGTSVAMGNARPVVQARATYVTDSVDEDGIWNAAVHFGLV